MKRRRLILRRETLVLLEADLRGVRAGAACSDPTCHICESLVLTVGAQA